MKIRLCGLVLLLSAILAAADVSGRWVGTVNVEDKGSGSEVSTPVEFQLEQKGDVISGKVGRKDDPDAAPIKNGKIDGGKITMDVVSPEILGPAKFTLRLDGEAIVGNMTVKIEEGTFNGKVKLKRVKP